jgi:hypothetical protein
LHRRGIAEDVPFAIPFSIFGDMRVAQSNAFYTSFSGICGGKREIWQPISGRSVGGTYISFVGRRGSYKASMAIID